MYMLKVYSPFDNKIIQEIPFHTLDDIENSIQKAFELHRNSPLGLPKFERIKVLENLVNLFKNEFDHIVDLAISEGGKPLQDSKIEVNRAIEGIKLAIQGIYQIHGDEIPMGLSAASQNRWAFTTHEPIGVVLAISAFNHPVNLLIHQVVTAIAAGCPVILKPSLKTPLSALKLQELLQIAGLPENWCTVIICENTITEKLVGDKRFSFVNFIGSAKVGWNIRKKLHPGTRCALEHGGLASVLIHPSATLHKWLNPLVKGAFYHAGQVCVSVQKVWVHHSKINEIYHQLLPEIESLKIGNPFDESTQIGSLISKQETDRVHKWVKEAIKDGADLWIGGEKISDTVYAPTVLHNPPLDSKVSTEEIFGPVVCVYAYENWDDAIELINQTPYHFQSAVFTNELSDLQEIVSSIKASTVMINDHSAFRTDWMPFGGQQESGLGVGGIIQTMKEYSKEKLIVMKF